MHIILKIFYFLYISIYAFTWIIFIVEFYKFMGIENVDGFLKLE